MSPLNTYNIFFFKFQNGSLIIKCRFAFLEYEGFEDVYGHSVEDDNCISPSEAGFLFDRTRCHQMSAFINEENYIAEEEDQQNVQGEKKFQKSDLSEVDLAKLTSCVEGIQDVIGDIVPVIRIEEVAMNCNFDYNVALDQILNEAESEQAEKPEVPSIKVVSAGVPTKGFEISDPGKLASHPRSPTPVSGRTTPIYGEDGDSKSVSSDRGTGRSSSVAARESRVDPEKLYRSERGDAKEVLHMVVIGHVDAGKSTLMGHLLFSLGEVSKKTMHKYEQESKKMGKQSFAYAWILDETGQERSRGITMDVGESKFETETKIVNLLDAPGHKDFIPNMITGATRADVAVLVVDATRGEFETGFDSGGQTREHALLVRSLGVSQLAVAVNKLDTVDWSEERFEEITQKLGAFLKQAGFRESDVTYVPCSGLAGENLVEKPTQEMLKLWYKGPCLLQVIDNFKVPERPIKKPLRVSVNDIYKGTGSGFCVTGRVENGLVQSGDRILVLPPNEVATVKNITIDESPVQSAFAGDSVSLTLANYDMQNINIGYILCDPNRPAPVTSKFEGRIVVFNIKVPITTGYPVVLHTQSLAEQATVSKMVALLNKSTGEIVKKRPRSLLKNSNAIIEIETSRPICLELYREVKELGRFMLRVEGISIAAGLVTKIY
ncbi:UNVERIFIED_CONTAM: hypothetical protein PYX00_004408 [Menopon gallinae]|uniref:Tr-type G domain-containing protein n=1 Tax=Menopon gallinae TaxID=328185 RepID=A0AAW2I428_9NEOP